MFKIDSLSYSSPFRRYHPVEKAIAALLLFIIVLKSENYYLLFSLMILMLVLLIFPMKIKGKFLLNILIIPFFFILIGIAAVVIEVAFRSFDASFILKVSSLYIGITSASINKGLLLFLRSYSAIIIFYTFILSTPMCDVEYLLKKLKIPSLMRELIMLTYRYIFITINIASNIFLSQKSRQGYINLKNSFFSLGELISSLFVKSLVFNKQSYNALLSRGYNGELNTIDLDFTTKISHWIIILTIAAPLIYVTFWMGL